MLREDIEMRNGILRRRFLRELTNLKRMADYSSCDATNLNGFLQVKLWNSEKATKFEKNLLPILTKQLFLLSSVKTSGRFFQIFVAFPEKLNSIL